MKNQSQRMLFVLIAFTTIGLVKAHRLQKQLVVHLIEEKVDQKTFTHRIDIVDGQKKEVWAIDGQLVEHKDYLDQLSEAERRERETERKKHDEELKKEYEFTLHAQQKIGMRILQHLIAEVKQQIRQLHDYRIEPYFEFGPHTIEDEHTLDRIGRDQINQAQMLITQTDSVYSFEKIQLMIEQLEQSIKQLQQFYQETILRACDQSDDTKLLKDLLDMVTHPSGDH